MQEEKELNEVLEMMVEKMLAMDKRIGELNEKQNKISNQELQEDVPTDSSTQIPLTGLDN